MHLSVTRYKLVEFDACTSGCERVELVYNNIPEEGTTVDRYSVLGLLSRYSLNTMTSDCGPQS